GLLMDALKPLSRVLRYGNVRQTDKDAVKHVVDGLITRICVGLAAACASLDDDAAEKMLTRIIDVHEAVGLLRDDAPTQPWLASLAPDVFQAVLPLLRRTFATFPAGERRQLGERVLQRTGGHVAQRLKTIGVDEKRADQVLPLVAALLGLPRN